MNTPIGQSTLGEMLPFFIVIGVLLLIAIFSIYMAIKTSKIRKKVKAEQNKRIGELGAYHTATLKHTKGLPVPEGTLCRLFLCHDKIVIECNGNKFNLEKSKLTDISMKTDIEIQKQYVSSIGGAVAGAVMFGALGAMIGGRAKEKKSKSINTYLIFTYKKGEGLDYIGFEITTSILLGRKFVDDFKSLNKQINSVNL